MRQGKQDSESDMFCWGKFAAFPRSLLCSESSPPKESSSLSSPSEWNEVRVGGGGRVAQTGCLESSPPPPPPSHTSRNHENLDGTGRQREGESDLSNEHLLLPPADRHSGAGRAAFPPPPSPSLRRSVARRGGGGRRQTSTNFCVGTTYYSHV